MAKKRQRVFALTAAVVFLLSSVAFTGLVIYQMTQQDKQSANQQDIAKQLQEQQQNSSKGKKMDNFTPVASVPELQKIDITEGTGVEAKPNDNIVVHYTLALAKDGSIVQSSLDKGEPIPLSLSVGSVIEGWFQGVPGMKVGGKRRLLIPASLAYKDQSPDPSIPANSDLVFDIELVDVPPKQQ